MEGPQQRRSVEGFSLIELMIVVTIISIVAAIAQPQLHSVLLKARAADVVADMQAVKTAVFQYQADHNAWPPDRNRGIVPPGLEEYLPDGFSFQQEGYVMDVDNWGGTPFNLGVTIITSDSDLGLAVIDLLGTSVWNVGQKYSWVID